MIHHKTLTCTMEQAYGSMHVIDSGPTISMVIYKMCMPCKLSNLRQVYSSMHGPLLLIRSNDA